MADWTDEQIWSLTRGGHDPMKVYTAYKAATEHKGQPTVILAKTVKGFGMGEAMEGQNIAHQAKKMKADQIRAFRDRFHVPIPEEELEKLPFYRPPEDSAEMKWLKERLRELGGGLPRRRRKAEALQAPPLVRVRGAAQEQRRARALHHHGAGPDPRHPACATRRSARAWCPSSPTRRAPSAWRGCSGSTASTRTSASSTGPRTPTS